MPSVEELTEDRSRHLAAVRQMFETLDVFVFTLGLTESWEHVPDGAALPLAPGLPAAFAGERRPIRATRIP